MPLPPLQRFHPEPDTLRLLGMMRDLKDVYPEYLAEVLTAWGVGATGVALNNASFTGTFTYNLTSPQSMQVLSTTTISSVMADFIMDTTGSGNDSGAVRCVARQLVSGNSFIRALEAHALRSGAASQNATWGIEVGVHSDVAGDGNALNTGVYVNSDHIGWVSTGVRNDCGVLVTGPDGWHWGFQYHDIDGTRRWGVDRYGHQYVASSRGGGLPASSGSTQTYATQRIRSGNSTIDSGSHSDGHGWIQVADITNLAVMYPLKLQPNGGGVVLGGDGAAYAQATAGSLARGVSVQTGNAYTVAIGITHVIVDHAAATHTLTLPAAAGANGREIIVRTIQNQAVVSASSNVIPLAGGAAGTAILSGTAGKWAMLISDGANWHVQMAN